VKAALAEALAEGRCDLLALRRFIPVAEVLADTRAVNDNYFFPSTTITLTHGLAFPWMMSEG